MSNPRSVVSFGIGFGALAIASIGLLPIAVEQDSSGGAINVAQQRQIIAKESARLAKQRKVERERAEELARLARVEAERNAEEETERQYVDLVARLSVVDTEEQAKPVELAPDAIERLSSIRLAAAQGVRLALNEHAKNSPISIQVSDDTLQNAAFLNDDEAMALIMILAEID